LGAVEAGFNSREVGNMKAWKCEIENKIDEEGVRGQDYDPHHPELEDDHIN
jgi:hypothetical protein